MKYPMLLLVLPLLLSCGTQREIESKVPPAPVPAPLPKPAPGDDQITFQEVQAITRQYCVRCHSTSQFLKSEAAWKASEAKQRVSNGNMPQAGSSEARSITAADRGALVNFQGGFL